VNTSRFASMNFVILHVYDLNLSAMTLGSQAHFKEEDLSPLFGFHVVALSLTSLLLWLPVHLVFYVVSISKTSNIDPSLIQTDVNRSVARRRSHFLYPFIRQIRVQLHSYFLVTRNLFTSCIVNKRHVPGCKSANLMTMRLHNTFHSHFTSVYCSYCTLVALSILQLQLLESSSIPRSVIASL